MRVIGIGTALWPEINRGQTLGLQLALEQEYTRSFGGFRYVLKLQLLEFAADLRVAARAPARTQFMADLSVAARALFTRLRGGPWGCSSRTGAPIDGNRVES